MDTAILNVTFAGRSHNLESPIHVDTSDEDIKRIAAEEGEHAAGTFDNFVVDRLRSDLDEPRFYLRPKVPFGSPETHRILVLEPGQPLEERRVEAVLGPIGGYATNLPQWVIPTPQNVSAIGREFDPGENALDNFESYEHSEKVRGTVILVACDGDGETVDLTDEQVKDLTLTVGRLVRSPAIETKRPSDRFTLVMLDEDNDSGEKFSENYGSMSSPWEDDQ